MLGFLIFGVLLISVLWRHKRLVAIGFCLLFLVAGICRHQAVEAGIKNNELRSYNNQEQTLTITGIVKKEPDIRENNIKLEIQSEYYEFGSHNPREISGKILVTVNRYPEYQYGDRLKITGKLKAPQAFEDFNYKDYLAKDGIYSVMYYPKIELLAGKNGRELFSAIYGKILDFKAQLREVIEQNLSPPQSSVLGAMMLGDKSGISMDFKEKLNISGLRHITCISGMHIAILTAILMSLLIGLGLWRQQAFYFTLILIALFILMTGFQSSAVRAGIMGGLFLLAQHLGRMNVSSRALVFAAACMLLQNPLLLKSDIGFQLSFLAMLGIIELLPVFRGWLKFIPEGDFLNLRSILAMTLSAQVFTLPILIYNFGYMSLVSPLTNILIVPLLPLVLGFGFLFGLSGMLWPFLAWILSWPVWMLLTYIVKITDFFSNLSFAASFFNISWIWLVISYFVLGLAIYCIVQKQKLKFLNY